MNWQFKALAFQLLDKFYQYGGRNIHYLGQRYVTKRLPRKIEPIEKTAADFLAHIDAFKKYFGSLNNATYFEFGAGWDIYSNLVMYCYGIKKQIVVDIKPLIKPDLVNSVITTLQKNTLVNSKHQPHKLLTQDNYLEELKQFYGIYYYGHSDARKTEFSDRSIDLIATTNTLEHIPPSSLKSILQECYRLCHERSVISMKIDYSDHYAHTDKKITPYNFLQYNDRFWSYLNPDIHYQNRLRHSDYRQMFQECGFKIISENFYTPFNGKEQLKSIKLDKNFADYQIEELAKIRGHFVLVKQ
jgi:hypothetical protein